MDEQTTVEERNEQKVAEQPTPPPTDEEVVAAEATPEPDPRDQGVEGPSPSEAAQGYAATSGNVAGSATVTKVTGEGGKSGMTLQAVPGTPTAPQEEELGPDRGEAPRFTGSLHNMDEVDLDLDERNVVKVKLGGRVWFAKEPTIEVNIDLALNLPTQGIVDETSREGAVSALKTLYPQVREVLYDPATARPPSEEFVHRHLTSRNFVKLMRKINEDAAEGNLRGV